MDGITLILKKSLFILTVLRVINNLHAQKADFLKVKIKCAVPV